MEEEFDGMEEEVDGMEEEVDGMEEELDKASMENGPTIERNMWFSITVIFS